MIDHAKEIPGWMSEPELYWLWRAAHEKNLVIEFGSWCGRSSVAMSSAHKLICVDTWAGSVEHKQKITSGFDPWVKWKTNTINYPQISAFRADLSDLNSVSLLQDTVLRLGGADMVFVDASHDYESVFRDIKTAQNLLNSNGILCGHDYLKVWPGVRKAVDELLPSKFLFESIWSTHKVN